MHTYLIISCSFFALFISTSQTKGLETPNIATSQAVVKKLFQSTHEICRSTLIDQETIEKLDIFSESQSSLVSSTQRTLTIFGETSYHNLVVQPTHNRAALSHRQAIIQEFLCNNNFMREIQTELKKIRATEDIFLSYFQSNSETDKEIESFFFSDATFLESCNQSPVTIEIMRRIEQIGGISTLAILPVVGLIAKSWHNQAVYNNQIYEDKKLQQSSSLPKTTGQLLSEPIKSVRNFNDILIDAAKLPFNYLDPFPRLFKNGYDKRLTINESHLSCGDMLLKERYHQGWPLFLLYGGHYTLFLINSYMFGQQLATYPKKIIAKSRLINSLHKKMQDIKIFIESLEALVSLAKNNSFTRELPSVQAHLAAGKGPFTQKFQQLKQLLNTPTIQEESSLFMYGGRILVAHKLIAEIKNFFLPTLHVIGELDAYTGIAQLMQDHQSQETQFCLVEFDAGAHPCIELTAFWHPIVKKEEAITNSLSLGGTKNPYGIILTGPHGCGKSTAMKAIALNLVLAHTVGIAAAKKARMSIFTKINTYTNIHDDINKGWSTFIAEQARVDFILKTVKNLKPYEFSFNMLDEVFKGTIEKEGAQRVFDMGQELATHTNTISIFAVHSELPTELEEYTHGLYQNFHVGLTEAAPGSFSKTFKLVPGKNDWWFNDSHKRKRFISYLQKNLIGS